MSVSLNPNRQNIDRAFKTASGFANGNSCSPDSKFKIGDKTYEITAEQSGNKIFALINKSFGTSIGMKFEIKNLAEGSCCPCTKNEFNIKVEGLILNSECEILENKLPNESFEGQYKVYKEYKENAAKYGELANKSKGKISDMYREFQNQCDNLSKKYNEACANSYKKCADVFSEKAKAIGENDERYKPLCKFAEAFSNMENSVKVWDVTNDLPIIRRSRRI
jgi:hypothetical protein